MGPFSDRPPTNGLTATTGAGAPATASRIPGSARIGPIEMTGFDGPITIRSQEASAARTSSVGRARSTPCNATPSTGGEAPATIMYSWNGHSRPACRTKVATG